MIESKDRLVPDAVRARRPDYETQAREALGMPPEWKIMRWEAKGEYPNYYGVLVTGAIPGPLKTRGKNKGHPNWSKRTMEASFTITKQAEKAWLAAWERDTGFCHRCHGSGQKFKSWNCETGSSYEPCPHCSASGLAPATQPGSGE